MEFSAGFAPSGVWHERNRNGTANTMTNARILIVQQDRPDAAHLEERLEGLGYTVCATVPSGRQAIRKAEELRPDLAFVDLGLDGDVSGIEAAERIGDRFNVPVIYLTDATQVNLLQRAPTTHPFGYVLRPIEELQLHLNIQTALSMHEREKMHRETETRLERTSAELRDRTELIETIFNSVSDGIAVTDTEGGFLLVNPSVERIVGMGATEGPADRWSEIYGTYYPDGERLFPADELPLARAMRGEASNDTELLIRNRERPEGVHISVNASPLQDDSGIAKGGVIVFRDITRLKETEAELKQTVRSLQIQTRTMETIFNSIGDGVVATDENGNFTVFNPSAERLVGIGMTDVGPDRWTDRYGVFFPDRVTRFPVEELPLVRAMRGEASDDVELFIRNEKNTEGVYINVNGRPLLDDSGVTHGGVIALRDVTDRFLAEEALLQAFAQGRLEVVDTILHNIGNAINSVTIGVGTVREQLMDNELINRLSALAKALEAHRDDWIPYLQMDPQGQKVMPFILGLARDFAAQNQRLRQTVERVDERVRHIVEIIRTQGSFERQSLARKDVNLRKSINDAVRLMQDSLAKRGIQIHLDCRNAPRKIRIQESRFHQMLVNLIKNAMEAIDDLAESGGLEAAPRIKIRSYVQEDFLVLDVTDNGIGIEEKHFKIIFSAGYTTKKTGSGLGLHSIANFVIGSGGQIRPLSAGPGNGTTMRIKLKLSSVAPQSENLKGTAP